MKQTVVTAMCDSCYFSSHFRDENTEVRPSGKATWTRSWGLQWQSWDVNVNAVWTILNLYSQRRSNPQIIIFNTNFEIQDNVARHEIEIKMNIGNKWMILSYVKLKKPNTLSKKDLE